MRLAAAAAVIVGAVIAATVLSNDADIDPIDEGPTTTTSAPPDADDEPQPPQTSEAALFTPTPLQQVGATEPGVGLSHDESYLDLDGWIGFNGVGFQTGPALGGIPHLAPLGQPEIDLAMTRVDAPDDLTALADDERIALIDDAVTEAGHRVLRFQIDAPAGERCYLGDRCIDVLTVDGVVTVVSADAHVLHVVDRRGEVDGLLVTATSTLQLTDAAAAAVARLADSIFVPS